MSSKLASSDRAIELVKAEGGLRHTSAKRYSFDDPDSLVFVVSHDGPVTVYSDGMNIIQLRDGPTYASRLISVRPDPDIGDYVQTQCAGCDRRLVVGGSPAGDPVLPTTLDCPICERPGLTTHASTGVQAWPVKPWSTVPHPYSEPDRRR
jgi:hypothetical protein